MGIIEKKVSRTIDTIETFFNENFYQVNFAHESVDKAVAKTTRKDDGLYFEISKMILTAQKSADKFFDDDDKTIEFQNFNKKILFNIQSCSKVNFSVGLAGYTTVSGCINEFKTDKLDDYSNAYYRAVIVSSEDFQIGKYFHCEKLKIKDAIYYSRILELSIQGIKLHVYPYSDKVTKRNYFFIETQEKEDYSKFEGILDEIVLAFTYLTGTFLGHEIYTLGSNDISFDSNQINQILGLKKFFDDLKSSFQIIPHVILFHELNVKVQLFETKYIELLVCELCKSLIYKRTILLICQANTEPHYVKATLYSVALETITSLIAENIIEKINPIRDKEIAKKIRTDLKATLKNHELSIDIEAFKKIESDIERINSPTNKKKLLAPFEHFNLKLPQKDVDAIERRNDFLHGRIPESADRHFLPLTNSRLLFCINCLCLKQLGFSGYIMYHPVMYQVNNKIEPEEYPIRKV
jgi:hypothetical protein